MTQLSFTGKRWQIRHDFRQESLASRPFDAVLKLLQEERGLSDSQSLYRAADLFPDFALARDRVLQALERKEQVFLFGDYDCDGITATAQMIRFFRRHGLPPIARLPHRLTEGYGLKMSHISQCIDSGATLLITIDTGISSYEEIKAARKQGIDVIILDHHHPHGSLPPATATLHPGLSPDFPAPHPSAAGVVALFVQALEEAMGHSDWEDRVTDLVLAATGTVGDLVELGGVNRSIVRMGLSAARDLERSPLFALFTQAKLGKDVTSRDLAFRIAPRINAAGRMSNPEIALSALLGDETSTFALEDLNKERQRWVAELTSDLLPRIKESDKPFLFAASEEYSPGIVGLIAGKLTEQFGKPSFVGSLREGICTASLRSIPDYHVTEGLSRSAGLLTHFGGHAQAAGCQLAASDLAALEAQLCADVAATVDPDALHPTILIDACMDAAHMNADLCRAISELEPYGQGNLEPRFLLSNVLLTDTRRVGHDSSHLQARAKGTKLIGFGLGHLAESALEPVDLVCRIGMETYMGRTGVQLYIDDMRTAVSEERGAISGEHEKMLIA